LYVVHHFIACQAFPFCLEIQTVESNYEELRTLFNGIFKYAVASGLIQNNPVALIKFKRAERQTREALSEDEILAFLERIKAAKYDFY